MKKIIITLLVLGALGGAGYYYTTDSAAPANEASPPKATSHVAQPPAAKPSLAPVVVKAPVELPKPAAAPKVVETVSNPAAKPAAAAAPLPPSPRAELATLLPELTRLIDTQDYETLMQDFIPPEELNALLASVGQPGRPMALAELVGHMRQDPGMTEKMTRASQFLIHLQSQTPTVDAGGESASYKMPQPFKGQDSIHFVKIDGNWYVKDSIQFFR